MPKSPEMKKTLDAMTKKLFGKSHTEALTTNTCLFCGREIKGFRNAVSRKEYSISGMCQVCQDKTFGVD